MKKTFCTILFANWILLTLCSLMHLKFLTEVYRFNQINRPVHSISMSWNNFRQPTAYVQQNIFGNNLIEVCSLHIYASFGTFCVQIGQLFTPQWVFKHSEEFRSRRHFPLKTAQWSEGVTKPKSIFLYFRVF